MNTLTRANNDDWYNALIEECKAIITETEFTARWALVEGYHHLGKRIASDPEFVKFSKGNNSSLQRVANSLGKSPRLIYYAVQFAEKYPSLDKVPGGKAVSWRDVCHKLLPAPKAKDAPPIPVGLYDIIYADPPWQYDFSETDSRKVENQYPTMAVEEIAELKIPTADDCTLFLWATTPKIREALLVLDKWGFDYKTNLVWDKEKIGMGYWFRGQHELLMVATKGDAQPPAESVRVASVYKEPRTEHSKKPDYFYGLVEAYFPNGKYLELFARQKYSNKWETWGNE